jgi:CheY-like chemotaxis protein/HPt (histidine-containing phosphotransfer) domain-containing protein
VHNPTVTDADSNRLQLARDKITRLRAGFLAQLPSRLAEARSLLARLDHDPGDQPAAVDLHRFLHSIKGTGRSFGLHELGLAAAEGEDIAAQLITAPAADPDGRWRQALHHCLDALALAVQSLTDAEAGEAELPSFALASATTTPAGDKARLVYICDDEAGLVEQLATQLSCFGYQTVAFTDTAALREAVLARRPDAVIMDIRFPEGQSAGTDVLIELRRDMTNPIPAIFLSGRDDFEARLRAVHAGGEAYFHKPARALELISALDELTRQQKPEPYRILIVDDEPAVADYHAIILQEAGMTTYQVNAPEQVLQVLAEFQPDMVLMDMYMPGCTGRDLAKLIRQVPDYVSLPIVYLSSETDIQKQFSAMRVGAEGFLTKPVVPATAAVGELRERVVPAQFQSSDRPEDRHADDRSQSRAAAIADARSKGPVLRSSRSRPCGDGR